MKRNFGDEVKGPSSQHGMLATTLAEALFQTTTKKVESIVLINKSNTMGKKNDKNAIL